MTKRRSTATVRATAFCVAAALAASGCAVVGPKEIRNGRFAYNEAITASNAQQLLMVAVHDRYEENANLLVVSSVTANVHVSAKAGVDLGYGSDSNYAGNLVPFSAGMTYEENPTITYVPVDGGRYVRQLMSPLPIAIIARIAQASADPGAVLRSLLSGVNGFANGDLVTTAPDARFERWLDLTTALERRGCLRWFEDSAKHYSIAIDADRCPAAELRDLLKLLGVADATGPRIVLPVRAASEGRDGAAVTLATRSVFELLQMLSSAIDVPPADVASGAARPIPADLGARKALRIAYAHQPPEHAAVSVPYRDGWFYIDDGDVTTKRFFRLIGVMWSATLADTAQRSAPVLTVPASR